MIKAALLIALCFAPATQAAQGSFELSREAFLQSVFGVDIPTPKRAWITGETRDQITDILRHEVTFLRAPYWRRDGITVWVLDEIGKEKPITTAVVLQQHHDGEPRIQQVKVLAFRESRGWEVKYSFFTDQFKGVLRDPEGGLSQQVDGITGATMSVNALKKQAEIALLLNSHVQTE